MAKKVDPKRVIRKKVTFERLESGLKVTLKLIDGRNPLFGSHLGDGDISSLARKHSSSNEQILVCGSN